MIELTDAECDKIAAAAIARDYVTPPRGTPFDIAVIYRIIVRAGIAAGIERAAQRVENGRFLHDDAPTARFARECAAAIRALLKQADR